jgi:hypothetical protein
MDDFIQFPSPHFFILFGSFLSNGKTISCFFYLIILPIVKRYFSLNSDAIRIKISFNYQQNNSGKLNQLIIFPLPTKSKQFLHHAYFEQ